ncbi:MAG: heavy metal-binding domain-containing protein [Alistipes sp.]|nr:heavy metal-binding domain-containing protein [Alistipes sp.]
MLVSTTNSLEGYKIVEYIDIVSTNVVNGSSFFSDWKASLTDIFGGRSGTYQRKLRKIYEEAIEELSEEAISLGANAVVGLKVDYGEISGKDTQMFMISAVGTAVKVVKL